MIDFVTNAVHKAIFMFYGFHLGYGVSGSLPKLAVSANIGFFVGCLILAFFVNFVVWMIEKKIPFFKLGAKQDDN